MRKALTGEWVRATYREVALRQIVTKRTWALSSNAWGEHANARIYQLVCRKTQASFLVTNLRMTGSLYSSCEPVRNVPENQRMNT